MDTNSLVQHLWSAILPSVSKGQIPIDQPYNVMKTRNFGFELCTQILSGIKGERIPYHHLRMVCLGFALGLVFLTGTALGDVVGYFKFDNFPGDNGAFTDDAGKGLRGLLGFPFSAPASVPGPSGQAGDLAVDLDGSGALAADDSAAEIQYRPTGG